MKIEKIDRSDVEWYKPIAYVKYIEAYKTIRKMKIGEAIKITLDERGADFGDKVLQNLRKSRYSFRLCCRCLSNDKKVWAVLKLKKYTHDVNKR